jgi:hypothetical protein
MEAGGGAGLWRQRVVGVFSQEEGKLLGEQRPVYHILERPSHIICALKTSLSGLKRCFERLNKPKRGWQDADLDSSDHSMHRQGLMKFESKSHGYVGLLSHYLLYIDY